jgi:GTP-binding protein
VGRIAIGSVKRGTIKEGMLNCHFAKLMVSIKKVKVKELQVFEGLGRVKVSEVQQAISVQ